MYIDIHQNGRQSAIEVATVGISKKEAGLIKRRYREIRNRQLADAPDVDSVDLLIEPLDDIEIGAWAAKAHGILSVVEKSLHVELPLYGTLRSSKARKRYAEILAAVLGHSVPDLLNPNHPEPPARPIDDVS